MASMASMTSGSSDLKWTSHNPCSFPAGGGGGGDQGFPAGGGDHGGGFYPHHMTHAAAAARDIQQSFLGASPMSHFAAAAATDASPTEGKPTMSIS